MTLDYQVARSNMVEQQIRTWEVLDAKVLHAIETTPRHLFVPKEFRELSYADIFIPIGDDQFMLPPKIQARMLQSLAINSNDRVLEIGTGTGYVSCLLGMLSYQVISMEIIDEIHQQAQKNLTVLGPSNITLECVDGIDGRAQGAPYDVIAVTGSVPQLDPELKTQLADGGRMFVVSGNAPTMEAQLITRMADDWFHESLFETVIPSLIGVPSGVKFVL